MARGCGGGDGYRARYIWAREMCFVRVESPREQRPEKWMSFFFFFFIFARKAYFVHQYKNIK